MYKKMSLVFLVLIAFLIGCAEQGTSGGDGDDPGGNTDPDPVTYTLQGKFFDENSGNTLDNVSFQIVEEGYTATINGVFNVVLEEGVYTLYASKNGYTTKGYSITFDKDQKLDFPLKQQGTPDLITEAVAGSAFYNDYYIQEGFYINTSFNNRLDYKKIPENDTGVFSTVAPCGNITFSASFYAESSTYYCITYLKNVLLEKDYPLDDVILDSDATAVNFTGTKPTGSILQVTLNDSPLARLHESTDSDYFSFDVTRETGDVIGLDMVQYSSSGTTYTKISDCTGRDTLAFPVNVPNADLQSNETSYILSFDPVSGASFYTLQIVTMNNNSYTVLLTLRNFTDNQIVIPRSLVDTGNDTFFHFAAITLDTANSAGTVIDTEIETNYSYAETILSPDDNRRRATTNFRRMFNYNALD